jgi:L-seryl-tRNA(Ser) seleniumtransferase
MSDALQAVPAVGTLLNHPDMAPWVAEHGHDLVVYALRRATAEAREQAEREAEPPSHTFVIAKAIRWIRAITQPSLRSVVNATGIVLHSNLGRAVLGPRVLEDLRPVVCGYTNLEFDLETGQRGQRVDHVAELLRYITGAEDIAVVNNNAAALVLTLQTLAKGRQVIVSRGELVEIGGSFRLPDVMKASGARLVEVGTTNRTRLDDYAGAMTERTALLMKVHRSNFTVSGFCEETSVRDLATLAHSRGLPMVYDIGSGLVMKPEELSLPAEPDVRGAIEDGADLVCFSGDKLLGGPQAGVIAGRREWVRKLAKAPLMRALRVGKLTLAALGSACRGYLTPGQLADTSPTFSLLRRSDAELGRLAAALADALQAEGVQTQVVPCEGHAGCGTLPDVALPGLAVAVTRSRAKSGQALYRRLLRLERPVIGILRQGQMQFDVRTVDEADIPYLAKAVGDAIREAAR